MASTREHSEELTSSFLDNILGSTKIVDHMLTVQNTVDGKRQYSYVVKVMPEAMASPEEQNTAKSSSNLVVQQTKSIRSKQPSPSNAKRANLHYPYLVDVKFVLKEPKNEPQIVLEQEFLSDNTLRDVVIFFKSEHARCSSKMAYCTGSLDARTSLPITDADLDTPLTYLGKEGCETETLFIVTVAK